MKILGLIPARGGSKGVPGKNIKTLNGKPLLAYTAEVAMQSKYLSEVILSSDDDEIIRTANRLGLHVPFKRPDKFAQDHTPSIDVVAHALDWFKGKGVIFDAVCLLQVTSPFRSIELLDCALSKFIGSGCDSLVSVQRVPHEYNPHWAFEVNPDGNLRIATGEKDIIVRRQELPDAYHRDGMIYITKTQIIEQGSLYGQTLTFVESPKASYVNIDTPEDWERAEIIAKQFRQF